MSCGPWEVRAVDGKLKSSLEWPYSEQGLVNMLFYLNMVLYITSHVTGSFSN